MCVYQTQCKCSMFYLIYQTFHREKFRKNLPGECKTLKLNDLLSKFFLCFSNTLRKFSLFLHNKSNKGKNKQTITRQKTLVVVCL